MSIKVQVKDNRGCTSTFTDRLNGSFVADGCTTNFATGTANCGIGVTPINATNGNWNAAYGQPMNVNTFDAATPFAAYSQPMTLGLSGQLAGQYATFAKPFGPAIQGGLPMTAGFNGMNISLVHTFIGRIAAMDPALGQLAWQIAAVDPMFVSTLATLPGSCPWTASKMLQVASLDLELARKIVKLAIVNPREAATIAQIALVNPVVATRRLAALGISLNAQPLNTLGFNAGQSMVHGLAAETSFAGGTMPIDVYDDGRAWVIEADLPGVLIDDVDITAANGRLIIEAVVARSNKRPSYVSTLHCESRTPRVLRREFAIGIDVETTEISARIVNGVLSIVLPKKLAATSEQFVSREGTLVI
jgi:HSP20 family molecular chaperone IbpA